MRASGREPARKKNLRYVAAKREYQPVLEIPRPDEENDDGRREADEVEELAVDAFLVDFLKGVEEPAVPVVVEDRQANVDDVRAEHDAEEKPELQPIAGKEILPEEPGEAASLHGASEGGGPAAPSAAGVGSC